MNISEISIRRPVLAWMLMAALIIFGAITFRSMGVSQLPDVDFPVVNVSVNLEGAAPEVMESDVVDPIESAIMSVEGVTNLSSSAKSGNANITVEFALGKNIDVAVQDVQTKIAQAQRTLPKDLDPPIVTKSNPEDQPIIWLAVSSEKMPTQDLMAYVRDQLRDKFLTVPGVGDVFLGGYVEPNLRVWVSEKQLRKYDLSVGDIINSVQGEHSEPPAGRIETAEKEFNVRTLGEAGTVEAFSRLAINRRGGAPNYTPIALSSVAKVEYGLADVRRLSRLGGKPALGLGVRKQRGVNSVEVADLVKKRMQELKSSLPAGVELQVNFDSTQFIKESISELYFTLILSAVLTALVCWLFLGSWSATLNVILAIPTSLIGTFIALKAVGFTLNTFTLLGLSLAIGIVVDDAIMVLENIVRHKEKGKSRLLASLDGSREIGFAALAATAAIIAIFLPVAFMKGIIGKFFFQFGVTISVAVALSLLEALTLTPMRCSQFLDTGERTTAIGRGVERAFHGCANLYRRLLPVLLNHRWTTVLASIAFFGATCCLFPVIKKEFVPPQDQGNLFLRLKAPDGSSLDYTDRKTREIEAVLGSRPEIERYYTAIGGFGGGDVDTAVAFVTLKPRAQRKLSQQDLAVDLREQLKKVKGVKSFVQDLSLSGFSSNRGYPVEFTIRGADFPVLIASAKKMTKEMEKTGLMTDIDSDYRGDISEIHIIPDRAKAQARGVSITDIGQTVSSLIGGTVAGKFSRFGHRYDIRVKLTKDEQTSAESISKLQVRNNRGELIPISDVVRVENGPGLQAISRQDRERAISVFANVAPKISQAKAIEAVERIGKEILPPGYRTVVSGSAKTFQESFSSLIIALMLGLLVSYMVLASQFNSFIHPITVLVALPFSISGALISLWVGHQSLNIYSFIGLILLMGIVKKNSILLVDFTNHLRTSGKNVREALIEAGPVRLRPILMTSLATIAGAVPPALAIGPGAESRIPMALAVIGGVFVSTLLTLFVVPCVYSLFSKIESVPAAEDLELLKLHGSQYPELA